MQVAVGYSQAGTPKHFRLALEKRQGELNLAMIRRLLWVVDGVISTSIESGAERDIVGNFGLG